MIFVLAAVVISALRPRALGQVLRTPALWVLVAASGTTNAAFNWAVVIGDVVRVVLLFYLMPLWTVLLARVLLGERFTTRAALRVALGLAGAAIVLWPAGAVGVAALPLPRSLADGLGLLGGFTFALNNVMLRREAARPEEGRALATVLFGEYNPAGRLVQTWPKSLEQLPPMMDYDIRHGRTYMYFRNSPLYPFGYGLSYTSFAYRDLKVGASPGIIELSVTVKNTGQRAGDEVVQLYVKHQNSKVSRPLKELKGFTRIHLAPQEEKVVKLLLPATRLAYWNAETDQWVVELDRIEVIVGGSSTDARLKKVIQLRE